MRTRHVSSIVRARRLRTGALAVAVVAGAGLLVGPAGPGRATAEAMSAVRVSIADESAAWKPSSNARVKNLRPHSPAAALQLKARRATGVRSVWMRSPVSTGAAMTASSTVRATARLQTSQPGRRLTFRVQEIVAGRVVASRSTTLKPGSRSWRHVGVTLRTTRSGSHLRLVTEAKRLRGGQHVRATDIRVAVTRPHVGGPACEDIDYSQPDQGVETFREDFDGSSIDRSRWRVRDNTFLNQDKAWITKDAVSVQDGHLDIRGRRLPDGEHKQNKNALYPANVERDYSTGYVDTMDGAGYGNAAADRFGQKYGHFEIRAWVPSEPTMSRGIWPAFWLRADHKAGEIDPMESYGGPTIRSFDPSSSYEWNSWADTAEGSMTGITKRQTHGRADVGTDKIWQGWHTYGVNWSPRCLRYLYDGRTVGIVDFDAPGTASYFRESSFDDTFHIRLNMQVGSSYWGWPDAEHTRDDFSYKVDWVRVHQGKDLLADR
ncbi:family 16 glycosylhydrolase [Aeromicrobium sp. SMF47]|uniref:glycoside hydrolase family 16 protein n=1 Tax=Aeromicrobium yanjiei TaxID=2662028 RepID=UPI00129E327F|nr:glycoside hydrolase family 16 protein [Aeromicrobium yanjiei]MRJ77478.1 family 16 glycosylhydrolase [Aeromicrobium yanjiei]